MRRVVVVSAATMVAPAKRARNWRRIVVVVDVENEWIPIIDQKKETTVNKIIIISSREKQKSRLGAFGAFYASETRKTRIEAKLVDRPWPGEANYVISG